MLRLVQCLFTLCMWAGADCLSCVNPPSSSLSESFEQHPAVCTVSPSCLLLMELATPLCSSSVCVMKLPLLLCSVFHTRTEHTDCIVCVCGSCVAELLWLVCVHACCHTHSMSAAPLPQPALSFNTRVPQYQPSAGNLIVGFLKNAFLILLTLLVCAQFSTFNTSKR